MQTLKTDIKQRILQVAHREFINNGVQRTCIRNVAHEAGVTVGNLYHYFDSKDTLFRAVLQPLLTALDRYILSHNNEEFLSLEVFDLQQHQINHVMTMLTLVKQFRPELRLLLFNAEGTSLEGYKNKIMVMSEKVCKILLVLALMLGVPQAWGKFVMLISLCHFT